jgi:carbon storage regulator
VLILSRREAERICLGDDIVLTIVALGNDRVRIGVQAPPGVRVLRGELEVDSATLPSVSLVSEISELNGLGSTRKAA